MFAVVVMNGDVWPAFTMGPFATREEAKAAAKNHIEAAGLSLVREEDAGNYWQAYTRDESHFSCVVVANAEPPGVVTIRS